MARQAPLVTAVALLAPWVAQTVVSVRLPEPETVIFGEDQLAHPLGALPELEMRHERPRGTAVRSGQRLVVVGVRDPWFPAREVGEWEVGVLAADADGT